MEQVYGVMDEDLLYKQEKSVLLVLVLAVLWCVPNLVIAFMSGSLVLLSDIPENFRFIFTNTLGWRILRLIRLGRLRGYDYGTDKVQIFGGLICSMAYIVALFLLAGFAIVHLVKPAPLDVTFAAVGGIFQLVLFFVMGWLWIKNQALARKQYSPVMEVQWRTYRADAIFSLVCFVSLMLWLVLRKWPWAVYIDPLFALVFVCYAIASFIPTLVAGVNDMLDKTLQEELQLKIDQRLAEHFHGYEGFHGVRSRRAGGRVFIEIALSFDPETHVREISRTVASLCHSIQQDVPGSEVRIVLVPCSTHEEGQHSTEHMQDSSGRPALPAKRMLPICDEQQYIFSVNEAVPSIPMKISYSMEFLKSFSPEALSSAVEKCIQTADVFGTRYVVQDHRCYMEFLPYQKKAIPVYDFASKEEYLRHCNKVRTTEINNRDKLYSLFIFSTAGSFYHLHFCFNHLIFDAISGLLLGEKIQKVLLDKNEEINWHPYAAYLEKIKRYYSSDKYLQDQGFWENRFLDISKCEYLFADVTGADEAAVKTLTFQMSPPFKKALLGYCAANKLSPHMVIVSVLARRLSAKTGRKRFYIEIPIGNRSGADEKNSLGPYEIGPPVIFDFTTINTLGDLLESVKKQSKDYYKHKNFDWNTKIFSEPYEKKYGRYIPQFSFSYFCENKKPAVALSVFRYQHSERDFLPMTVHVSDYLDWQAMTFAYIYWADYFSEEEMVELHKEVEAGIAAIVERNGDIL